MGCIFMYLKRLEMQGFKTFAQKTALEFVLDRDGRRGVTAIVGPNGSGKSNTADALRWVMGEQSLKLLRGKKSEDVIFSGTDKRARSGFAEVTMILENDDRTDIEFTEIALTRRLFRDGNSEYEINKKPVRMMDVALLLAQCGVGQRTYSVIGQGMVDAVLVASPSERKEFFDEAFGLKPFQLKRTQALNRIETAQSNLVQTEGLIREIVPRLHSLERQAKRLQERESIELELRGLEKMYYVKTWVDIESQLKTVKGKLTSLQVELQSKEGALKILQTEFDAMEQAVPPSTGFRELRQALDRLNTERAQWREKQMELQTKRAVAMVRAEKPWAPLPLSKIIDSVDILGKKQQELDTLLSAETLDREALRVLAQELRQLSQDLLGKLQRPAPEPTKETATDPAIEAEAQEIASRLGEFAQKIVDAEGKIEEWNRAEEDKRQHIFEVQRRLGQKRSEVHGVEQTVSQLSIELARLETRREAFLQEVRQHAPQMEGELAQPSEPTETLPADAMGRIQKLRSQLEWIGGIDPETIKEYQETQERHGFLAKQTDDLRETLASLDIVVRE